MHKEIIILITVGMGAFIAYSIYNKPPKKLIIPAKVQDTEASTIQEETKTSPFSFSKEIPETFNYITPNTFQDSGQALARARQ